MTKNWRTDIYDKLSPERRARIDAKADQLHQEIEIQSVTQPKCVVGRTLLTMDWCYTHMRYVINCIDLKLTTEDEVFNCYDDVETSEGRD